MKTKKITRKSSPKRLSVCALASEKEELEYDKDFSKWANNQAEYLRKGEFSKLDIDNLIEEIEDLSKREKQRLMSYLENLLMHKLKVKFQKLEIDSVSWNLSIEEASRKSQKTLSENLSLKPKVKDIVEEAYSYARLKAAKETRLDLKTFPEECPWILKEIFPNLEDNYCKINLL
jgi:Domain of unknown function DUF29